MNQDHISVVPRAPTYLGEPSAPSSIEEYKTIGDLLKEAPIHIDRQRPSIDVALKAKERLSARRNKLRVERIRSIFMLLGFLCAIAGAFWYLFQMPYSFTSLLPIVKGYNSDIRKCSAEIGGETITGERTFTYPYQSLFGFRLIDESRIIEQTKIAVNGYKVTVVGITGSEWWRYNFDTGEVGPKVVNAADNYIFLTAKSTVVVPYEKFCQ